MICIFVATYKILATLRRVRLQGELRFPTVFYTQDSISPFHIPIIPLYQI